MALYDKEEIKKTAIEAIKKHNLFFISDIVAYVPCSTSTFYLYFPEGSEESETFKELLEQNRIRTKSAIRAKLFQSNKAGELLALYRLICTPDERRMLNQQYIEMNTNHKGEVTVGSPLENIRAKLKIDSNVGTDE